MKKLMTIATVLCAAAACFAGTFTDGGGTTNFPENGGQWGKNVVPLAQSISCSVNTTTWRLVDNAGHTLISGVGGTHSLAGFPTATAIIINR
jgi:hypothetical protein